MIDEKGLHTEIDQDKGTHSFDCRRIAVVFANEPNPSEIEPVIKARRELERLSQSREHEGQSPSGFWPKGDKQ